jgi:hypothetical protein
VVTSWKDQVHEPQLTQPKKALELRAIHRVALQPIEVYLTMDIVYELELVRE